MTEDLDVLIDRIVGGGLSPAELRQALKGVAAQPEGWRRCTLAFLEARALDEAFREPAPATIRLAVPVPRQRSFMRPALAAAVVLACFASGWLAGRRPQQTTVSPIVAAVPAPAPEAEPPTLPQPELQPRSQPKPQPAVSVPAWVLNQPPPVSPDAQAALEARGYRLEQHRRILATRLPDGRRVVVPVDRVGVSYVGGQSL
ncbi:hypothetical protein [Paludisphaera rhizosphaerae]|uniref:hypothetical protein n=1 Tax=Paludisphaera rhizosphaerae TaxID=2711216 RepID=UPI0013EA47C9|nr:hypothetical protein [Paludisphaera rhizosphaerae]